MKKELRKMSMAPALILAILSFNIQAEIISAKAMLLNAQKGQMELLNTILDLKDNVRELRDRETFEQYFDLLNPFEQLSQDFELDEIYPNVVADLGKSMVAHGNRWLRISKDNPQTILKYQHWADLEISTRFKDQVLNELAFLKTSEEFKQAALNIKELIPLIQSRFQDDIYLLPDYQKNLATVAFLSLRTVSIHDEQEWIFWIEALTHQDAISNYILFVSETILSSDLQQNDALAWHRLVLFLGLHIQNVPNMSLSVTSNYNMLLADLIIRMTYFERTIDLNLFKKSLPLLGKTNLKDLGGRWVNTDKPISHHYALHFLDLSQILLEELSKNNMGTQYYALTQFISHRMAAIIASKKSDTGHYKLKDKKGGSWSLTFVTESEDRLILSLRRDKSDQGLNYFNIEYHSIDHSYHAAQFQIDDTVQNNAIVVKINEDNTIKVTTPFMNRYFDELVGKKVYDIEEYHLNPEPDANPIYGDYKGYIVGKSGKKINVFIRITPFGNGLMAHMEDKAGVVKVNFNKGNDGKEGYLYLTSAQTEGLSWIQLRLKLMDDETLSGKTIIGGVGMTGDAYFKKVN